MKRKKRKMVMMKKEMQKERGKEVCIKNSYSQLFFH